MTLESSTAAVELADEFVLDGTTVTLVDTPGFDDTSKSDADILKIISAFLATTYVHTYVHSFSILWTELVDRYKRVQAFPDHLPPQHLR